ncbi:hypothetical protein BEN49_04250 [Hymenobacter coccineus]|uniref:Uncharacterized protein n=2 Tax=Hymenobacter coccineus TaxID=1908235 RepID=A0A1G1TLR3_9BACT|nr:hypothetical protein BEN49_04250 [Hymenobacter coccineus]
MLCTGALLVLLAGCKKDLSPLEQLPDATEQGLNTAGWLLEGKAWVPVRSTISTGMPNNGYWKKSKTGFSLAVSFHRFSIEEDWGIEFYLPDIRHAGTFVLNQDPAITGGRFAAGYGHYVHSRPAPNLDCYTSPNAPGELIITRFDTVQNIVSGTFTMAPQDDATGTPVQITQGRFDLKFDHR